MDFSNIKKIQIEAGEVKQIAINGEIVWKSGYTNQVPLSINSDGSIYNNGLGYKNGYRVRSGGAEQATNGAACTGFIPAKAGDVVRISGCNFGDGTSNRSALNVSNSYFENIGQFSMIQSNYGIFSDTYSSYGYASVVEEKAGVWKWVVPPAAMAIAYIRVTGNITNLNPETGAGMIVTVNEEIEE